MRKFKNKITLWILITFKINFGFFTGKWKQVHMFCSPCNYDEHNSRHSKWCSSSFFLEKYKNLILLWSSFTKWYNRIWLKMETNTYVLLTLQLLWWTQSDTLNFYVLFSRKRQKSNFALQLFHKMIKHYFFTEFDWKW